MLCKLSFEDEQFIKVIHNNGWKLGFIEKIDDVYIEIVERNKASVFNIIQLEENKLVIYDLTQEKYLSIKPENNIAKFKLTNFTECTEENGSYFYLDDGKIKSTQNESLVLDITTITN